MKATSSKLRTMVATTIAMLHIIASAGATTVIAPDFNSMVRRAELIFTGRAVGQRCEWREIAGQRSIVTLVTFEISAVHKGNAGRRLDLQFLGGTIGDTTLEVEQMPRFSQGERAVLFVTKNGIAASPLVGFHHGRYRVERDESGRDMITSPQAQNAARSDKAAPAEPARHLSHEELVTRIREAAGKIN